jgi:hypothetical protein
MDQEKKNKQTLRESNMPIEAILLKLDKNDYNNK